MNNPEIRVDLYAKTVSESLDYSDIPPFPTFQLWGGRFWQAVPRIGEQIEVNYYKKRFDEHKWVRCRVVDVLYRANGNIQTVDVYFEWPKGYSQPEI